jgi:hypothetical protein
MDPKKKALIIVDETANIVVGTDYQTVKETIEELLHPYESANLETVFFLGTHRFKIATINKSDEANPTYSMKGYTHGIMWNTLKDEILNHDNLTIIAGTQENAYQCVQRLQISDYEITTIGYDKV